MKSDCDEIEHSVYVFIVSVSPTTDDVQDPPTAVQVVKPLQLLGICYKPCNLLLTIKEHTI